MDEDIKQHRETCGDDLRVLSALDTLSEYCKTHNHSTCVIRSICHRVDCGIANLCDLALESLPDFDCRAYRDGKCHWGCKVIDCRYNNIRERIFHCCGYAPKNDA